MSGHSKWHSIRHKKGAADAKRAAKFTKLAHAITVTAREGGGDLDINFGLRLAVEKAKAANMPKDNIERAITRGTGDGGGGPLEVALYEAMGPGGAAMLIEAVTDNTNRTVANVKTILGKNEGNFDAKVLWMFERKGVIRIEDLSQIKDQDYLELELIDKGVDDVKVFDDLVEIICPMDQFKAVLDFLTEENIQTSHAELEYVAENSIEIDDQDMEKLSQLIDILDEDDDIKSVYTNIA